MIKKEEGVRVVHEIVYRVDFSAVTAIFYGWATLGRALLRWGVTDIVSRPRAALALEDMIQS